MEQKLPLSAKHLPSRSLVSNLLITALSAGLVIWALRLVHDRFTSVSSVDSVINGTIIDINAPREGIVSNLTVSTGDAAVPGQTLLTLENRRVSKLKVQEIESQIKGREAELQSAQARLAQLLTLLQSATVDNRNQSRLEVLEAQQAIEQATSDLQGAQARQNLAQLSYDRAVTLEESGAIATAERDLAEAELQEHQAEVNGLKRRLEILRANQRAAELGLTLARTRSEFDPRLRLSNLWLQIADQRRSIQMLEQQISASQAELVQAQADVKQQEAIAVNASTPGVIWQLAVQPGRVVQQGERLGQVIDCRQRWVDAYVSEQALQSIQPGTHATIQLYGASKTLQGQVSLIRSGIGRVAAGQDVVVPIASNLPREAQVRVMLNPDAEQGRAGQFCYVGYTGRVTFNIR